MAPGVLLKTREIEISVPIGNIVNSNKNNLTYFIMISHAVLGAQLRCQCFVGVCVIQSLALLKAQICSICSEDMCRNIG